MSEISKLYKNAGVEKQGSCSYECSTIPYHNCKACKYKDGIHWYYPPFTAEKQLLLLQWLLDKTDLYLHRHKTDFTYSIASDNFAVNKYKDFKESIAEFINAIWHSLTQEEKQEVKGILK